MRNIYNSIKGWVLQKFIDHVYLKVWSMITISAIQTYIASITEAIKPWLPLAYFYIFCIGFIILLIIRFLIVKFNSKNNKEIDVITEEKILFLNILPYCNYQDGIPRIGMKVTITNSSEKIAYCTINPEVTNFHIDNKKGENSMYPLYICVPAYSCLRTLNCLETKIQNIEIYQKQFLLEFHLELDFYADKQKDQKLFTKKCHYKALCCFIQDAIQRNYLRLEILFVECKDVPEIQFSRIPTP